MADLSPLDWLAELQQNSSDHTHSLELTRASEITPQRVEWLWNGRIPLCGITGLVGPGGLGKSTLVARLAADLTHGSLDGALEGESAAILLCSAEDTEAEVLVPRLLAAGADLERVAFPKVTANGTPAAMTFPEDLGLIADAVRASGARLVALDPLVAYVSEDRDTHRDHHVRRVLAPMAELVEELQIAVLGVVHVNKRDAKDVLERVGGSVAFVNAPRSVLAFGADPDAEEGASRRVLAHAKSNWGERRESLSVQIETCEIGEGIETSRAIFTGKSATAASELFVSRSPEERSAAEEARELLAAELAAGPRLVAELKKKAAAAGVAWRTCERERHKLGIKSRRQGFGGGVEWEARDLPAILATIPASVRDGEYGGNPLSKPNTEHNQRHARQHTHTGEDDGGNGGGLP